MPVWPRRPPLICCIASEPYGSLCPSVLAFSAGRVAAFPPPIPPNESLISISRISRDHCPPSDQLAHPPLAIIKMLKITIAHSRLRPAAHLAPPAWARLRCVPSVLITQQV